MMLRLVALALAAAELFLSSNAMAYYGRHSTEATLRFSARADIAYSGPFDAKLLNSRSRERGFALGQLHLQIQHLMGVFQSESFREAFGHPGALGETYDIAFTSVEPGAGPGRALVEYEFDGPVVFGKEAFRSSITRKVPVILPLAHDRIYKLGVKRGKNRCTDREFNSEEDFWYYWDPEQRGCPLAGNDTDLVRVTGRLNRLPNTRVSYPEYDRLYGDNGNGATLDIAVLIGYIRYQDVDTDRPNRRDEAFRALRHLEEDLKERDFALTLRKDRFRYVDRENKSEGINFLRRYERIVEGQNGPLHVRIFVLLSDTDLESKDRTFRHYIVPVMRNADIMIYDGHSNLGKNFDLSHLPEVTFNRDKYQILFFNGCSTYPYLNGMYFRAKGGTRNVEIITAGLPSFAESSGPNLSAFLESFLDGKTLSYQKILSTLERSNGDLGTFLVGVKGDEDNLWHPQ